MTTAVRLNLSGCEDVKPSEVHLLPCTIGYSGNAPVAAYFGKTHTRNSQQDLMATYRGRFLYGKDCKLGEDTMGLVMKPVQRAWKKGSKKKQKQLKKEAQAAGTHTDDDVGEWEVCNRFEILNYWNYDMPTAPTDDVPQWLDWVAVAAAVAENCDEDDDVDKKMGQSEVEATAQ